MIENFNFIDGKRGFISIEGIDAEKFLNGLITNDIKKLDTECNILYTCLLSAQGKYESDFFIFKLGSMYILDCLQSHVSILIKKLTLYKLRADVTICDVSDMWHVKLSHVLNANGNNLQDPRHDLLGYRSYQNESEISDTLLQENNTQDKLNYNHLRLSLGIPCYPASLIPDKTIPLEANFDEMNAIAWDKGCYLGQELTARTKYRGTVNKRYLPVLVDHGTPEIGWEIQYQGEKVGSLLEFQGQIGLARLSIDVALQVIKRQDVITQKYCVLRPIIPAWLQLY